MTFTELSERSTVEATSSPIPRRYARTAKRIPISVAVKQQGRDVVCMVNTLDISEHGLRVQTNLHLEPGQAVYAIPTQGNLPSGYCRVVWTRAREAGLEFVN